MSAERLSYDELKAECGRLHKDLDDAVGAVDELMVRLSDAQDDAARWKTMVITVLAALAPYGSEGLAVSHIDSVTAKDLGAHINALRDAAERSATDGQ